MVMAADWYADAREAVLSCLSSILSIDDRLNNPDHTNDGLLLPDMTVDERARLAYYTETDRATLARKLQQLTSTADWAAVVEVADATAESARLSARSAYDLRMAALTNPTVGTA